MTAVIVFTNNANLSNLGIQVVINNYPHLIKINDSLWIMLFDDRNIRPTEIINKIKNFEKIFIVFHNNGATDKQFVINSCGDKYVNSISQSHIKNNGKFYDVQLRKVLASTMEITPYGNWDLKDKIENSFLLAPFWGMEFEAELKLLHKLRLGNFNLNKNELELIEKYNFQLTDYQKRFGLNPNYETLRILRNQLIS